MGLSEQLKRLLGAHMSSVLEQFSQNMENQSALGSIELDITIKGKTVSGITVSTQKNGVFKVTSTGVTTQHLKELNSMSSGLTRPGTLR